MKKVHFKFFKPGASIFIGFFLLTLVFNSNVFAQDNFQIQVVGVKTTGYSVLSTDTYILGGEYYGNTAKKPFTTYFEYKKDSMDLKTGAEETIKTVREKDAGVSGVFYASPSLQLSTTYYFRAVGYFNDSPSQKFYGETSSFRTGYPFAANIPFTLEFKKEGGTGGNVVKPYNAPPCNPPCVTAVPIPNQNPTSTPTTPPTPIGTPTSTPTNNTGSPSSDPNSRLSPNPYPDVSSSVSSGNASKDGSSNLVPCIEAKDCTFDKLMELVNNVIRFILFKMVVPIAAIMFAYAGFLLITAGGEAAHARTKAKDIFSNAVIGLIIAVAAWLIVRTLLSILGYDGAWIFDKF